MHPSASVKILNPRLAGLFGAPTIPQCWPWHFIMASSTLTSWCRLYAMKLLCRTSSISGETLNSGSFFRTSFAFLWFVILAGSFSGSFIWKYLWIDLNSLLDIVLATATFLSAGLVDHKSSICRHWFTAIIMRIPKKAFMSSSSTFRKYLSCQVGSFNFLLLASWYNGTYLFVESMINGNSSGGNIW